MFLCLDGHDDDAFCMKRRTDVLGCWKAPAMKQDVMKKFAVYGFSRVSLILGSLTRNVHLAKCVGCDLDEGYGIASIQLNFHPLSP